MHCLEEDLQIFSVKDVIVNILDFVDENYLTLPCGGKAATDKERSKYVCVPVKLYLQKQAVACSLLTPALKHYTKM